jgi:hypothetical protein
MDSDKMTRKYPDIIIREYLETDLEYLANNLRDVDRRELEALFDEPAIEGLKYSIENADSIWVVCHKQIPCMIFGISDRTEEKEEARSGLIWAVGTDEVYKHKKALHEISQNVINNWFEEYDVLFNYIWDENTLHKTWLKSLGFLFFEEDYIISATEEKFVFFCQFHPDCLEEE